DSWMRAYLPDHLIHLGVMPNDDRVVLLTSLARDRLENCVQLRVALTESLPYAQKYVLMALSFAYRQQAVIEWANSAGRPVRDCFVQPLTSGLGGAWLTEWRAHGMPG